MESTSDFPANECVKGNDTKMQVGEIVHDEKKNIEAETSKSSNVEGLPEVMNVTPNSKTVCAEGDGLVSVPKQKISVTATPENGKFSGPNIEGKKLEEVDISLPEQEIFEVNPNPREAGFTSEKFKIEISGLPKRFGFVQLKKRLAVTLGLNPHKLKAPPNSSFAFVCFSCEDEREKALQLINGHVWKGKTLSAKKSKPSEDPMAAKRKAVDSLENGNKAKKARLDDNRPASIRLRSSLEPLWEVPYEEQLQMKTERAKDALKGVAMDKDVRSYFKDARKENDGLCCPMQAIKPSPVLENYRNKSEFSIGRNEDGSETVVGFRFGLYKDGTDCVGSPAEISITSADSRAVAKSFEKYVRNSQYAPFDHRTHNGHWRQLTVRTTRTGGGTMVIIEFVVQNTTQEEIQAEKDAIRKYFTEGDGKEVNVTTLFFRPCSSQTSNSTSEEPYQLIFGEGHIFETMMDMKFRISPSAFFQVNTAAAEELYRLIGDWCSASPTTTVLDVCCGTGTIGLSMAKRVSSVIGIEMCKEAVEDAKVNARLNGIANVTYHCAKVENVIHDIMHSVSQHSDVIAILDPPRSGVHPSVIKSLRSCEKLKRIVFAACNPAGAKRNFIDLCRQPSKKTRGEPFRFVQAIPVDMFPSTNHFELVVLFERGNLDSSSENAMASTSEIKTENGAADTSVMKTEDGASDTSVMKTEDGAGDTLMKTEDGAADTSVMKTEDGAADTSVMKTEDSMADISVMKTEDGIADTSLIKTENSMADMKAEDSMADMKTEDS